MFFQSFSVVVVVFELKMVRVNLFGPKINNNLVVSFYLLDGVSYKLET